MKPLTLSQIQRLHDHIKRRRQLPRGTICERCDAEPWVQARFNRHGEPRALCTACNRIETAEAMTSAGAYPLLDFEGEFLAKLDALGDGDQRARVLGSLAALFVSEMRARGVPRDVVTDAMYEAADVIDAHSPGLEVPPLGLAEARAVMGAGIPRSGVLLSDAELDAMGEVFGPGSEEPEPVGRCFYCGAEDPTLEHMAACLAKEDAKPRCEGSACIVCLPDPLGLEDIKRTQAIACLGCGAPLTRVGQLRSGPGCWVAYYCERAGFSEGRVTELKGYAAVLNQTDQLLLWRAKGRVAK